MIDREPDHDRLPITDAERVALEQLPLLTAAEREVFRLIGLGIAPPAMASQLGRKKSTIETHLRHIGQKLGLRGIQRLTRIAILAAQGAQSAAQAPRGRILDVLRAEIGRHRLARTALDRVVGATSAVADEAFLRALVASLGGALGAEATAVLERDDGAPESLRIVAWWSVADGCGPPPVEVVSLDRSCLRGSKLPAAPLTSRASKAVTAPESDPLLDAVKVPAALVEPLLDAEGHLLGGIVLFARRPLPEVRSPELIVRLMGARVATELECRRAERRLRESERRYRTLAENASDVITQLNTDGVQLYVSPAVETLLGFKPDELVGRSAYDLVHPHDIAKVGPIHSGALDDPSKPQRARFRLKRHDDSLVWVESIVRAVVDQATGRVVELLAMTRDIGAEQEAIEALNRSRERLEEEAKGLMAELRRREAWWRSVVEQAADSIFVITPDRLVRFANRTAPAGVDGDVLAQIVDADRDRVRRCLDAVLNDGTPGACECSTSDFDGIRRWDLRCAPMSVGGVIEGAIVMARDITSERAVSDRLAEREATYRRLVDSTPLGIFVHDGASVVLANPAAASLLGYPSAEAMSGIPVMELADPAMRELVERRIRGIIDEGANQPMMPQRLRRQDGTWLEAEVMGIGARESGQGMVQVVFRART